VTSSTAAAPAVPTSSRPVPAWAVLAIASLGQYMVVLDVSIVNVALPSIRGDLGFSASGLQWVVNAYTIVFAGFLLLGGRAADLFGQRRLFLIGLGLFTCASLAGGFAQGETMLIAARVAQGLGGAVLSPATLTIITTTFREPARRARALGVWSAVAGAGGASGALLGGILTDYLSWRWILFVNVPVGLAGLVLARLILPENTPSAGSRHIDIPGAFLVTGGLVALVYGIVASDSHGWSGAATLTGLAVGGILLACFVAYETRVADVPLVPMRLFRSRRLTVANLVMFFLSGGVFASWYFLTLYMQNSLGYSPLKAGLAFLPQTLAIVAGAQLSGRLVGRLGARFLIVVAGLLAVVGLGWLSRIPVNGTYMVNLLVPCVLIGTGLGVAMTPIALSATAGLPRADGGLASGVVNAMRMVGGALGLAVLATLALDHTHALAGSGDAPAAALVAGYGRALGVAALSVAVAVLVALALPAEPGQGEPTRSRFRARMPRVGYRRGQSEASTAQ
jgi:EmrB/QacA subfamily drug resistance transporter